MSVTMEQQDTLPIEGPVRIENRLKRVMSVNYIVGSKKVLHKDAIDKTASVVKRLTLGSMLDRTAAAKWNAQKAQNDAERLLDPSVPEIDERTRIHSPDVLVSAEQWEQIRATPNAINHLRALARQRYITINPA